MAFTDMMSSGRGPGVVGLIMALFVLIGFGILFVFVFDEDFQGGERTLQSILSEQGREMEAYGVMLARNQQILEAASGRPALVAELDALKREGEERSSRAAEITASIEREQRGIEEDREEFLRYREDYRARVREGAKGLEMAELVLPDGTVYQEVSIREVSPIGIQIRHREGQRRIPYEMLPKEMIDHYQFDDESKEMAVRAEREILRQHEDAVAAALPEPVAASSPAGRTSREEALRQIATRERQIVTVEGEVRALEKQLRDAESAAAAARAAGRVHSNQTAAPRAQLATKRKELAALRQNLDLLKKNL
jgi:hypothetical protein